jgi:hypothetical protein
MSSSQTMKILFMPFLVLVLLGADAPEDEDDIPVVGRPADLPFSGASGNFRVRARADPTTLEAETPLTFTLTVEAAGAVRHPPRRLDLRTLPAFSRAFHVDDLPDPPRPDQRTWEFAWRLKPRRPDVTEVPGLPFVFYNPDIRPADKAFQVLYTDPIPLTVREPAAVPVPVQGPEDAFTVATGPEVLARRVRWGLPGSGVLVGLLAGPPLACAAWYLCWRRLNPDAARIAEQHRSRAARRALHRLEAATRLPPEEQAARAGAAVTDYLQERLELGPNEPTPAEARAHLLGRGWSAELAEQTEAFYRACDAGRFLPAGGSGLAAEGARLVLTLEAATWQPQPS